MKAMYRCWAEVDLSALRENLAWIRNQVGPQVKIMTVVKADAYGHGLKQIAALLMQSGTDIFGVANLTEARSIRAVGKGWPILLLGACLPEEMEGAVRDDVMPTVSTLEEADQFAVLADHHDKLIQVQIKVDTGMGRLGVEAELAMDLIRHVRSLPGLELTGLYTHYAAVEDDPDYSQEQAGRFNKLVGQLQIAGISIPLIHANNSGGLLHEPSTLYNLIRPGLLVYGVVPSGQRPMGSNLKYQVRPALAWKCRVGFVKEIPAGKSLSYGRTFVSAAPMRVATLTAGYGDGYLRAGSNRAQVLIRGRRLPVLGRITMDQMLVDITTLPEVNTGDEAVFIGRQDNAEITVNEVADWMGTIPWEVFTNITYRVPRIYRGGQAS